MYCCVYGLFIVYHVSQVSELINCIKLKGDSYIRRGESDLLAMSLGSLGNAIRSCRTMVNRVVCVCVCMRVRGVYMWAYVTLCLYISIYLSLLILVLRFPVSLLIRCFTLTILNILFPIVWHWFLGPYKFLFSIAILSFSHSSFHYCFHSCYMYPSFRSLS